MLEAMLREVPNNPQPVSKFRPGYQFCLEMMHCIQPVLAHHKSVIYNFAVMIGPTGNTAALNGDALDLRMKVMLGCLGVLVAGSAVTSLFWVLIYGLIMWALYKAWEREDSRLLLLFFLFSFVASIDTCVTLIGMYFNSDIGRLERPPFLAGKMESVYKLYILICLAVHLTCMVLGHTVYRNYKHRKPDEYAGSYFSLNDQTEGV